MVQIPRQDAPSVNPISASGGNYQRLDTNPDMFGAAMGRALVEVGQGLDSVGNAFGRIAASAEAGQHEKDTAVVGNAFNNAIIEQGALDAEYLSTEGQAAVDGQAAYTAKVQELRQKYLDTLPTPELKQAFDNQFSRRAAYSIIDGQKHAAAGLKDMTVGAANARVEGIYNDAAIKAQDDNLSAENLGKLDEQVNILASAKGLTPDETTNLRRTFHSGAWAIRIQQIALNDAPAAMKMLNENRDQLTAKDLPVVENTVHSMLMNRQANITIDRAVNGGDPATEPNTVGAIAGNDAAGQFLQGRRVAGAAEEPTAISGMTPTFRTGLANLINAAPPGIKEGLQVGSGHRTYARQTAAWRRALHAAGGNAEIADNTVAPPGRSQHEFGNAADLYYNGKRLDQAPANVIQWVHAHAAEYGLRFRLDNEVWHIESTSMHGPAAGERGPRLSPSTDVGESSLLGRVIGAESGGVSGLTSPKGALGVMQVMPETGRLVANMLGIPFSAERLRTDPQYNMLLGKTYLGMMLRRYSGNQALAVAAYNAGPGRVDRWIKTIGDPRTGRISNEAWAAAIPIDETRNYTTKILGASGAGAGPGPVITANSTLADRAEAENRASAFGLQDTNGVFDPDYDALLRSGVRARWNEQKQEADAQYAGVYGQVSEAAFGPEPGKGPKSTEELLTTDAIKQQWAQLSNKDRATIGKILESNSAPAVEMTNEALGIYNNYRGQALMHPEEFAAIPASDIIGNEKLPMGTKKELLDLQQTIKNGKKTEPDGSNVAHDMEVLRLPLIAAGIDVSPTTGDVTAATRLYTFVGALSAWKQAWMKTHDGKPPNDDEVRKGGSDLLRKVSTGTHFAPTWNFGQFLENAWNYDAGKETLNFEQLGIAHENLDVTFNAVPPPAPFLDTNERAQIVAAYKRQFGGKEPSEETINTYALRRRFLEKQKTK